jgi:acyl-coenzyme A synthetase/AMP-(fatty) acid ligase
MPKLLIGFLRDRSVSTIIWAVSALRIVADFKTLDDEEPLALENVMFSGEVMPVRTLNYWMDHLPDARYVNLYGPTEITCNCTYHVIDRRYSNDEMLPIGKAFRNSRVFLLDEEARRIADHDRIGEICVSGSCLALGYWNDPAATAKAFVDDPLVSEYPLRIYKTGDLGYYNDKNELVFVSRKDSQIKHMGHRIELGEVETAVNGVNGVEISCCLYDQENCRIVCFYQAKEECGKEIALTLAKALPKYMWPAEYVYYKKLPLNRTSKIDRVLLKQKLKEGNYGTADQDHE